MKKKKKNPFRELRSVPILDNKWELKAEAASIRLPRLVKRNGHLCEPSEIIKTEFYFVLLRNYSTCSLYEQGV